jgi:hypothetical protein
MNPKIVRLSRPSPSDNLSGLPEIHMQAIAANQSEPARQLYDYLKAVAGE